MSIFKYAVVSAREVCRTLIAGIRCLREMLLLCGGLTAVTVLLHQAEHIDDGAVHSCQSGLTTSMRAGVAAEGQPDQPIYGVDLQPEQDAAWIRRGDACLDLVSLMTGQILYRTPISSPHVFAAAHSRAGQVHAWSSFPDCLTILRDDAVLIDEPQIRAVVKLSVSADGSRVAAADDGLGIQIWDLTVSPPLRIETPLESRPIHMEWSTTGDRLILGYGNGLVTQFSADGRTLWLQNHDGHRPTAIAWSPLGDCVAVGQYGGDIVVLSADDGSLRWRSRQDSIQVSAVSFSPDGQRLVTSGFDRTVNVISATDGMRLRRMAGHYDMVSAVQFLPDGDRIVSGSLDGTLRIWSASAGRQLQKM